MRVTVISYSPNSQAKHKGWISFFLDRAVDDNNGYSWSLDRKAQRQLDIESSSMRQLFMTSYNWTDLCEDSEGNGMV